MTDIQKLRALLTAWGVEFTEEVDEKTKGRTISCASGNDKVGGYSGFVTDFVFTVDGTFLSMGAWE
jgi:hypothetical protein